MEQEDVTPNPKLRVLFVEDNPVDAELALIQLKKAGFEVTADIVQTVDDFRSKLSNGHFDIVLSDLGLPNWSGLDALAILKQTSLDIPFIMVTGNVGEETVAECLKLGATDYVYKDRPTRLPTAIRRALQEKALREERGLAQEQILRLAAIVESSNDAIIGKTLEGVITTWNKGAEKLYGYSAVEVLGQPISILALPDRPEELAQILASLGHGAIVEQFESVRVRKDGSHVDVSLSMFPLTDSRGKVMGVASIARDITERKRAEESLHESEERFRSTFENAGIGMALVDMQGHPIKSNPALRQMFGYSGEELSRMTFTEFSHPDDRELDWGLYSELAAGKREKYEIEKRYLKKGGGVVWGQLTVSLVKGSDGRPLCAVGMVQDITERKRAEEEMYKSRQMLKSILDTIPQRVFWKDRNILYLGCNQAFAMDAGLKDPAEIIGKDDHDLTWKETAERYRADDKRVMEQETPRLNFEEPQNRPDGSVWSLLTNKLPLRDREGKVIGVIGTYEDISARKRAEEEHTRLMTAIEQAAEGVVVTDAAGEIAYVNPAFSAMTGYSREEALGKNPRILKSGNQDAAFYKSMWATILAGEVWRGEMINRRKDGSLYTENMSITPVRNEHGKTTHFVSMKEDITARKLLEDQFRQAQKMEAVGRLAAGVAHDFNNLLTIIIGYSDMMLEQFVSGDPLRAYTIEIKGAGERAVGMTRQLLAFSRQQVVAPQVLDLNTLVANLTKLLKRLIGEDIDLVFNPGSFPATVKADPGHIDQVLMNLAVNSRDAMPRGGKLTIETSPVQVDGAYSSIHFPMPAGPYVMLAVSDTGSGMGKEIQSHIFEPFFTTKAQGKGTGLGLATVYGMVKQSGGYIWVYSEPGAGTTFKIYLPAVTGTPEAAREIVVAAGGSETILLVEDDAGLRGLARLVLEGRGGYQVLESSGGNEAQMFAGKHKGPIHLLLTDVVMPGMSGRELSEGLAALRPEMKILYMSGYTDDTVLRHGVLEEGMAFLQKPFTAESLLRKVREVLDTQPQT